MKKIFHSVLIIAAATQAIACNVPVFRYALDRWKPDPYVLQIPEGAATAWPEDKLPPMLETEEVEGLAQPRLLHRYGPNEWEVPAEGELTLERLQTLSSSPVREEIAEKILGGDSIVFLLLTGSETEGEKEQVAFIEKHLKELQDLVRVPPLNPMDPDDVIYPGPPLKIRFSTLVLDRNKPEEQDLVKLLLETVPEEKRGELMIVPMFGRARVLSVIPTEDPLEELVDQIILYLCGACSCQVKSLNPGWDLWTATDWEAELKKAAEKPDGIKEPSLP